MKQKQNASLDKAIETAKRARGSYKTTIEPLVNECMALGLKHVKLFEDTNKYISETIENIFDVIYNQIETSLGKKLSDTGFGFGYFENASLAGRPFSDACGFINKEPFLTPDVGLPQKIFGMGKLNLRTEIVEKPAVTIMYPVDDEGVIDFSCSSFEREEGERTAHAELCSRDLQSPKSVKPIYGVYLRNICYEKEGVLSTLHYHCYKSQDTENFYHYQISSGDLRMDITETPEPPSQDELFSYSSAELNKYKRLAEFGIEGIAVLKDKFNRLKVGINANGSTRLLAPKEFIRKGQVIFELAVAEYMMSKYSSKG